MAFSVNVRGSARGMAFLTALLVLSAAPVPVSAAALYDSLYAGESAFPTLAPGESTALTVFFWNTGTTTWTLGGPTQVDLAVCLEDKISCDRRSPLAEWDPRGRSAWRTSTRYAPQAQATVPPGALATFTYTVRAPVTAASGTYRFGGDLVVAATGALINAEGYYHEVGLRSAPPDPLLPAVVSWSGAHLPGAHRR